MTSGPQDPQIHPTAEVDQQASIGAGTKVWHYAQVLRGAEVGENCTLGKGVFVDRGVKIGDRAKLQNNALIYQGAELGTDVFIGPGVVLTNDRYPRASTPDGEVKTDQDWVREGVVVQDGASIGANATLGAGISIGRYAMVGAGAVVLESVRAHSLVVGVPAREIGSVCICGQRVSGEPPCCGACGRTYRQTESGLIAGSGPAQE